MEIKQIYQYKISKTHIVFLETSEGQLKLIHFSPDKYENTNRLPEELIEAATLVEVQITGLNQPDHKGNKLGNTLVGKKLVLNRIDNSDKRIKIVQFFNEGNVSVEVVTTIDGSMSDDVFVWKNKIINHGIPVGIEYITSLNITAVNNSAIIHSFTDDELYIPNNSWQGELQWEKKSLKEFGLEYGLDGESLQDSTKVISRTNNSSWSCSQYSPFAVLYTESLNRSTFWQLENNGEWHWELTDCGYGKFLALRAGGPTESTNHWWKELKSDEVFETIPVAYGTIQGNFIDAIQKLNNYRRSIRKNHRDNIECPIIFNDYMNSLMGDPTTEKELPMIDKAAEIGCEYYVIDCGWYSDGYWWDNVGEWLPSTERFPEGLSYLTNYIRKKGMIPGLWLEIEVMGINSEFANSLPDDWFICRHGQRIKDHSRYHLDFRNGAVRKYAATVIERLVSEYGVGYIKMDYNTPAGIGSDINSSSFSEGLLEHNRSYINWLDQIFKKYPSLVIENCGSGGMRHDYMMLSRHSIQSVTDQTDYLRNAAIAAICATGITPEQAAIWSYPLKEGDTEEVIFNMVSSLLFRVHQSGHLADLSSERFGLVKEAMEVYKSIRPDIPQGQPNWYTGLPHLDDEWFSFSLELEDAAYLAVWRTESLSDQFSIPIPYEIVKIEQIYPMSVNNGSKFAYTNKNLTVEFPKNKMARLFKIYK